MPKSTQFSIALMLETILRNRSDLELKERRSIFLRFTDPLEDCIFHRIALIALQTRLITSVIYLMAFFYSILTAR